MSIAEASGLWYETGMSPFSGRFGCSLGRQMTVPLVVFTHIPKTAGASFTSGMAKLFAPDIRHIVTSDDDDVSTLLPRLGSVGYVGGHIRFPVAHRLFEPDTLYLAALRDPVDRICSHYFFVLRKGGLHPSVAERGLRKGFDVFYASVIRQLGRINLQCRFFCDSARASDAIATIEQHYTMVWDSRRTEEAWPIAASLVIQARGQSPGDFPPLTQGHVAPVAADGAGSLTGDRPASYRRFLGDDAVERLLEDNLEDARLYRWLTDRGGFFRSAPSIASCTSQPVTNSEYVGQ